MLSGQVLGPTSPGHRQHRSLGLDLMLQVGTGQLLSSLPMRQVAIPCSFHCAVVWPAAREEQPAPSSACISILPLTSGPEHMPRLTCSMRWTQLICSVSGLATDVKPCEHADTSDNAFPSSTQRC